MFFSIKEQVLILPKQKNSRIEIYKDVGQESDARVNIRTRIKVDTCLSRV